MKPEFYDGSSWLSLATSNDVTTAVTNRTTTLTGAVTGTGTGNTIATILNSVQTMATNSMTFNWGSVSDCSWGDVLTIQTATQVGSIYKRSFLVTPDKTLNFFTKDTCDYTSGSISATRSFAFNEGSITNEYFNLTSGQFLTGWLPTMNITAPLIIKSSIGVNNNLIQNVATPVSDTDAATKAYVDSTVSTKTTFSSAITVTGSTSYTNSTSVAFYTLSGGVPSSGIVLGSTTYSLLCTYKVRASDFHAFSSIERKDIKGEGRGIESEALDIFKTIPLFKYEHKDKFRDGGGEHYGIIAEELNKTLPQFVDMDSEDFVPNIMAFSKVKKQNNKCTLHFEKAIERLKPNSKIQILKKTDDESITSVVMKCNSLSLEIDNTTLKDGEEVFVYGEYKKCPTVAKQKVFELNLVVTKNLLARLEEVERKLENLTTIN